MALIFGGNNIKKKVPESYIFSTEENNKFFTRSLLSEEEQIKLDSEGILSIEQVRSLVIENTTKGCDGENTNISLDVELLIIIDSRINYNIYIVDDNIYLYEELYMIFPFQEFNVDVESVFTQQTIGFFTNGETTVVDAGEPVIAIDDLVGLATKKNYVIKNKPDKIINSKIYIGKEKWKDFVQLHKFFRGIARVSMMQIENSATPEFLKPFTIAMNKSTNLLEYTDTVECEKPSDTVECEKPSDNEIKFNAIEKRLKAIEDKLILL